MLNLNSVCKEVEFDSDLQLYKEICDLQDCRLGTAYQNMNLKSINIISGRRALVHLEADYSLLEVKFFSGGRRILFEDNPCNSKFMTIEQINFIDRAGEVTIKDRKYDVERIDFCIDSAGTSYVKVYLPEESEDIDYE